MASRSEEVSWWAWAQQGGRDGEVILFVQHVGGASIQQTFIEDPGLCHKGSAEAGLSWVGAI